MAQFIVGAKYYRADTGFDPITILRRTDKTVWVSDGSHEWSMRVRHYYDGSEYAVDYTVPKKWQDCLKFDARFIEEEE